MPITKHNFTVRKVEDLADTMRAAFRIAQSGRKGPVLVDIPKDVTANSCEFTHKEPELIRTVTRYNEGRGQGSRTAQSMNRNARSSTLAAACAARQAASLCVTCWKRPVCPPPTP